ncbi:hypothetical protein GOB57_21945 [Sinorhizobium meliloti]|nr:hypothetical protein [Sinorhizobium meliloti]
MDRYDFGAPVRVTERGFKNYGDDVVAEVEFQNEHGVFLNGPKGGFMVSFAAASYEIAKVRTVVNGREVGHMPGAELSEFDKRLEEGVDLLDMEGLELVEDWLEARDEAKGYLLSARIGEARSIHFGERSHPVIDADDAISRAISEERGGISVLITGQRTDRLRNAVAARRTLLELQNTALNSFKV